MILVAGEALFDFFQQAEGDAADGALSFEARLGGSPFNVAVALARLGVETGFLGGISTDFLGARLEAALASEGVSLDHVARKEGRTTLGFVAFGADGGPAYAFYGEGAADRSLAVEDLPDSLGGVRAVHMGSYSLVTPPTADALAALAERVAGERLLAVDPNVRPTVEPDIDRWRARVGALVGKADVLKMSDEDLALLWPGAAIEDVAAELRGAGAGLVVVTEGAVGARAWSAAGSARVETPTVDLIDTVGAGDTFQAAMLWALDRKDALAPGAPGRLTSGVLEDLLSAAAASAALCCSRRGANAPRLAELESFRKGAACS